MAIPKEQPMLTVKEAAQILGVDPRTIREKLHTKQIRGEKKLHGLKEKWYVNKSDIDALANEQHARGAKLHESRIDTEDIETIFEESEDAETIEIDDVSNSNQTQESASNYQIEGLVAAITKQFSQELSQQTEVLVELKKEIEEKDRQLRLLPDLEKQAREKEEAANLKAFENEALMKQLELLKEEKEKKSKELDHKEEKAEQVEEDLKSIQKHFAELEEEHFALKQELEEKIKQEEESKNRGFWSWFTGSRKN